MHLLGLTTGSIISDLINCRTQNCAVILGISGTPPADQRSAKDLYVRVTGISSHMVKGTTFTSQEMFRKFGNVYSVQPTGLEDQHKNELVLLRKKGKTPFSSLREGEKTVRHRFSA